MFRSLTATVLMALMALSPGIPALAQQDWKRSERDILLCRGEPFEPGSLAGYEACFSARLHPDEQSWPPLLPLIGLYFTPHSDYSFCFVGAGKPGSLEAILVGRSGELIFGLDSPSTPSELEVETPQIIQRKARILEVYKHTFSISQLVVYNQLVVYDETELNLEGFVPVTAPPGYLISPDEFLEAPQCQAILN
jgi:hypothetical protein